MGGRGSSPFGNEIRQCACRLKNSFCPRVKQNANATSLQDFPSGAVVKSPPANARDTGSSPGPGRSHMPWNS